MAPSEPFQDLGIFPISTVHTVRGEEINSTLGLAQVRATSRHVQGSQMRTSILPPVRIDPEESPCSPRLLPGLITAPLCPGEASDGLPVRIAALAALAVRYLTACQ